MSLQSINFNLIPVLRALQREQSVSRAAKELGLTQSAVSAALARLRVALGDPLLVRVGGRMQLTPRAYALIEPVNELCRMMDNLVKPAVVIPEQLVRNFVIGTADWVALHVGTCIAPVLKVQAPHVNLQFCDATENGPELVTTGRIDLAIVPRITLSEFPAHAMVESLFEDDYVLIMAKDHPLASLAKPTSADLAGFRYMCFHLGVAQWDERLQHGIAGTPSGVRVSLMTQHLCLMPMLALATGDIAIAPRTLAQRMAAWLSVRIVDMPGSPVSLEMCMVWGAVYAGDPEHKWFRRMISQSLQTAVGARKLSPTMTRKARHRSRGKPGKLRAEVRGAG